MRIGTVLLVALILCHILISCSSQREDWQSLVKLQDSVLLSLDQPNLDRDSRIRACEEVILAATRYLQKYPDSGSSLWAKDLLHVWQERRDKAKEESRIVPLNSPGSDSLKRLDTVAQPRR